MNFLCRDYELEMHLFCNPYHYIRKITITIIIIIFREKRRSSKKEKEKKKNERYLLLLLLQVQLHHLYLLCHQNTCDHGENTQRRSKNFDHQHFDKKCTTVCIRNRTAATHYTN